MNSGTPPMIVRALVPERDQSTPAATIDLVPICVDLDGTLVDSDTLIETIFALLKQRPVALLYMVLWLFRGKAFFKARIAEQVALDGIRLPVNWRLVQYLRAQKALGRRLVLATAANQRIACRVADTVNLFDEVIASNADVNLAGDAKREALVHRFGEGGYDYAGNSSIDLKVWQSARNAIVVNGPSGLAASAAAVCTVVHTIPLKGHKLRNYLKCLRVHQWAKNALVLVPLLTSHQLGDPALVGAALLAITAFSLCSSSVYILNDLLDLSADRGHRSKRRRPLASGRVSIKAAVVLVPLLLLAGMGLAMLVNLHFLLVLMLYYGVTLVYSFRLKSIVVLDVLVLAGLYVIRVIAGAEAIDVPLSFWLLAFSMFIFLSLALVKRSAELIALRESAATQVAGRGYRVADLEVLNSMGTASGYLSVLVLALYIHSEDVVARYASPEVLWLLCPVVLYWMSYVWLRTGRGEMNDDPVLFALKDRQSLCLGAVAMVTIAAALQEF